jgi:iron complex transport system ATP-binding protein
LVSISIKDLSFAYRHANVLENLTIDVGKGEIVGLVGPNGSGKTTLIKCIDHILKPKGSILIGGNEIGSMTIPEVARHIGYVPQTSSPVPSSTVFDVVLMGRRCYMGWRVGDEDVDSVTEILRRFNLDDMALRDFNTLSGGQKQKILIARALCQNPEVLLLDEPTSNLDLKHQLEALQHIRELVEKTNISVVMSIHDLNLASRFADRLVMLKEGEIVAVGPPASLITPCIIRDVYGVEAKVVHEADDCPFIVPIRAL